MWGSRDGIGCTLLRSCMHCVHAHSRNLRLAHKYILTHPCSQSNRALLAHATFGGTPHLIPDSQRSALHLGLSGCSCCHSHWHHAAANFDLLLSLRLSKCPCTLRQFIICMSQGLTPHQLNCVIDQMQAVKPAQGTTWSGAATAAVHMHAAQVVQAYSNAGAESVPLTAWLTQPGAAMWCYMTAAQDSLLGCTWRQKTYMNDHEWHERRTLISMATRGGNVATQRAPASQYVSCDVLWNKHEIVKMQT